MDQIQTFKSQFLGSSQGFRNDETEFHNGLLQV
jgi:hypothetical protein